MCWLEVTQWLALHCGSTAVTVTRVAASAPRGVLRGYCLRGQEEFTCQDKGGDSISLKENVIEASVGK